MIFSVIVPTYNRCESLKKTIESIRHQDFKDFELIVVNDGSSDATHEYLSRFIPEGSITYIFQENRGPARARNAGINAARGTFAAFTDDDCVVPPDWLARLHAALSAQGIEIVGGSVRNTLNNIYAETVQQMTNHFVDALATQNAPTTFLTSNNIAYRLDAVRAAGGFDERFARAGGEERALHMKIIDRGGKSAYLRDCAVDHAHVLSFGSFLRQQFNYGKGSFLLYRVAGRELGSSPRPIPTGVYLGLFGRFFAEGFTRGMMKSFLYVVAECAVLAGYVAQAAAPRSLNREETGGVA